MEHWLEKVANHHQEWLRTVRGLGGGSYSEDIVQEAYLKLWKYGTEDKVIRDGEVSKGYVFFTLKTVLWEYFKKREEIEPIDDYQIPDITCHEEEIAFEKICKMIDKDMKDWHFYDRLLYNIYKKPEYYDHDKTSMRKLADKTDISWVSIFHTIKECKERIKEIGQEAWDKYLKGKYDEI